MAPFIQRSHCSAHKGSLASKAVASVELFKQVEALVGDVYNFLSASPKMVRKSCCSLAHYFITHCCNRAARGSAAPELLL